jgi:hypothetical protein
VVYSGDDDHAPAFAHDQEEAEAEPGAGLKDHGSGVQFFTVVVLR